MRVPTKDLLILILMFGDHIDQIQQKEDFTLLSPTCNPYINKFLPKDSDIMTRSCTCDTMLLVQANDPIHYHFKGIDDFLSSFMVFPEGGCFLVSCFIERFKEHASSP